MSWNHGVNVSSRMENDVSIANLQTDNPFSAGVAFFALGTDSDKPARSEAAP